MLKVGIITMYFNSKNYGGLLQAFALTKCISEIGCKAEQLCWQLHAEKESLDNRLKNFQFKKIFFYGIRLFRLVTSKILNIFYGKNLQSRASLMKKFELSIPHSSQVYDSHNIENSLDFYDVFITGSDQVWNLGAYKAGYFLNYVPSGFKKISYAASMPDIQITEEQKTTVKNHLQSFDAISVREQETAPFLHELSGKPVEWVLDPTLLLGREDWDLICSERIVEEKYIFCYFLGKSQAMRKQAMAFSKKTGIQLVTLPHLYGTCLEDINFGHIKLYDVSPAQFISLIKHAEYVLTDSFHAVVFSNIYKSKFFVFNRLDIGEMSSRITSLLSLINESKRFCTGDKMNVEYMLGMKEEPLQEPSAEFYRMQEKSLNFLKQNLIVEEKEC